MAEADDGSGPVGLAFVTWLLSSEKYSCWSTYTLVMGLTTAFPDKFVCFKLLCN